MNIPDHHSPLPDLHANDDEISRYAGLLDSLGVGLMVFTSAVLPVFSNKTAKRLNSVGPFDWKDEDGRLIPEDELPHAQVQRTSRPVFDHIMVLETNGNANPVWLSTNALPVYAENGDVRCTLLTLNDISNQRTKHRNDEQPAIRDALTGVFNKTHVMYLLGNEIHRARRYGTPFTLAQIEIDSFGRFCTEHGNELGDIVRTRLGRLLSESMREIDIAGRIGVDSFLLVLPNVSMKDALVGLERLRVLIETQEFSNASLRVTISGGITEYTGENPDALVDRAASLLVNARDAGQNRYCLDLDII